MRINIRTCLVLAMLLTARATDPQDNYVLDLSTAEAIKQISALTGECTGGRSVAAALHHPETWRRPQVPLKLEILGLSGTFFNAGDYMTAELRLTNVGDKDVMLPWNIHASTVYGPKPRCKWPKLPGVTGLRASIYLELVDETGHGEASNADASLYGISTDQGSYRYLNPGQSATIRVSGRMYPPVGIPSTSTDLAEKSPQERFKVVGVFKLDNSSERGPYEDIRSNNQLTINISPK